MRKNRPFVNFFLNATHCRQPRLQLRRLTLNKTWQGFNAAKSSARNPQRSLAPFPLGLTILSCN